VSRVLVIACGALVREIRAVVAQLPAIDVEYLPAPLHNRPERIPNAVRTIIERERDNYTSIAVAYADCGTGGLLDAVLDEFNIKRLPGAHCYEFFSGADAFRELHDEELGTFFLTDYLARHFDTLILDGLGITKHPQLREMYFGNYTRLVYLAQTDDPVLDAAARRAAESLHLVFERRATTLEPFRSTLLPLIGASS
jgi:Protein of unknown function (DUF1638)